MIKCREQIARSEEECRSAQRELKRLHTDADDQRDALVNEVRKLNKQVTPLDYWFKCIFLGDNAYSRKPGVRLANNNRDLIY